MTTSIRTPTESPKTTIHIKDGDTDTYITPTTPVGEVTASAFGTIIEGDIPSNEELDELGKYLEGFLWEAEGDEQSKMIGSDAEKIVRDTITLLHDKNSDELLQQIYRELSTTTVEGEDVTNRKLSNLAMDLRNSFKRAIPKMIRLTRRVVVDPEFKNYIVDVVQLLENKSKNVDFTRTFREEEPDKAMEKISEKTELTEEEKQDLINRSVERFLSVKRHDDYKNLMSTIFDILDDLDKAISVCNREINIRDRNTQVLLNDIKEFVQRFSGTDIDLLVNHWSVLFDASSADQFYDLRVKLRRLFVDYTEKYNTVDKFRSKLDQIYDEIDAINKEYNNSLSNAFEETVNVLNSIAEDPDIQRLTTDWSRLVKDIVTDTEGRISVSSALDSFRHLNEALLPLLKRYVGSMGFPNIRVESPKYDYEVRNLQVDLLELFPENLVYDQRTHLDVAMGKDVASGFENSYGYSDLRLKFHPLDIDVQNLDFNFEKKTFIQHYDAGKLKVQTNGGSVELIFRFIIENGTFRMEYQDSKISLKNFEVEIIEAKKKVFDKLFFGIFKRALQVRMEQALSGAYTSAGTRVCDMINTVIKGESLVKTQPTETEKRLEKMQVSVE